MGKKNKKKGLKTKQKKAYVLSEFANNNTEKVEQDDGFQYLKWTTEGKKKRFNIQQRMSSKLFSTTEEAKSAKDEASRNYDPTNFVTMLDIVEDYVNNGKYKKALKVIDKKLIEEFIEEYEKISDESPNVEKLTAIATRVLKIGKSFFEYSDNLEFINDKLYDGLLAKFLKMGGTEPMGIIPKGLKNQKKVDIKYDTLHNNMNKAYILKKGDPIPEGVKEDDSVEAFLYRTYKNLGIDITQEIEVELSPKIDGISMNATINGNMIVEPQTRGDKEESIAILGLDNTIITKNPLDANNFGIQYEIFVTNKDRKKVSEYLQLDKPYVSNRHAASGIIHRLSTVADDDLIDFLSFYPINAEGLEGTYQERMDAISNYGIVPDDMIKRKTIKGDRISLLKEIKKYYEKLEKIRSSLSYAIDGMVITIADDDYQNKLGRSDRKNKWQIAYKFDPATAIGYVKDIHLDSGKKGYRTIQVDLKDPVYLDGVEYDHIPVPTAGIFDDMNLHEGDVVKIHRVGDVIPAMTVIERGKGKAIKKPTVCPDCGEPLNISKKRFYCANPKCPGNIVGRFAGFFEKLGLDGYGESFAIMLHDKFNCTNLVDVLRLDKDKLKSEGVESEVVLSFPKKLKETITKKHDYEILGAMGIPGIANEKAKLFVDEVAMKNYRPTYVNLWPTMQAKILGGSVENTKMAVEYMTSDVFIDEVNELNKYIKKFSKPGKEGVIRVGHTGADFTDEVMDIIEMNGFEPTDGSKFDILITADKNSNSAKMQRAVKLDIPVFTQHDFIKRYKINLMDIDNTVNQMILHLGFPSSINKGALFVYILQILEAMARTAITNYPKPDGAI